MIMIDLTLITAEVNFSIEGMEIPTSIDPQYLLRSSPEEILDLIYELLRSSYCYNQMGNRVCL